MRTTLLTCLAFSIFLPFAALANDGSDAAATTNTAPLCDMTQPDLCYDQAIAMHYGNEVPKDKALAHQIFASLCEADMSKACHAATMSVSRYSRTPDYEKAMYFQTKGCDLGTARSCFVLGRSSEAPWGNGVKADHDKAREYFNRACDLGMGLACRYAEVEATGYRLR